MDRRSYQSRLFSLVPSLGLHICLPKRIRSSRLKEKNPLHLFAARLARLFFMFHFLVQLSAASSRRHVNS